MIYRAEIDGLRALAILPVLAFHSGVTALSGGFLGVDVFFVISGFLITHIILKESAEQRFSLFGFYMRRARRILPALFLVLLASIPPALYLMIPDPLENFGQSLIASALSANNILLWLTSGYWSLAAEFKPLLHTWSLGIEEQFYILFPLIFLCLAKTAQQVLAVLLLTLASFVLALIFQGFDGSGGFYLIITRAWELGLGALAAFWDRSKSLKAHFGASALGLLAIVTSFFFFSAEFAHPSYPTLIPVLGTCLVLLFARGQSPVARLLAFRPFVWIGLISYSLYLWHQPLLAYLRISQFEPPSTAMMLCAILLCFPLSYVTWAYVEQPFRKKAIIPNRLFGAIIITAGAAILAIGAYLHFGKGLPARHFTPNANLAAGLHISYNERIHQFTRASFSKEDRIKIVVIGRSHARDFANIVIEAKPLANAEIIYQTALPLCDASRQSASQTRLVKSAQLIFYTIYALPQNCQEPLQNGDLPKSVIFIGPKDYGYNLNAYLRLPKGARHLAHAKPKDWVIEANQSNRTKLNATRYIDLISTGGDQANSLRVFNDDGFILSPDRIHLTKFGAEFFAARIDWESLIGPRLSGLQDQ